MTAPVPPPRLRRARTGAVLGGVCAGVARSAGMDPLLLRIALVAVTVLTGGVGVPAYLVAWVLIPREPLDVTSLPPGADRPGPPLAGTGATGAAGSGPDVRTAWSAVGDDLRSLTAELRQPAGGAPSGTAADGTTAGTGGAGGTGTTAGTDAAEPAPTDVRATGTGMPAAGSTPDDAAAAEPPAGAIPPPRSPLTAADDAATALGDRLRTPEVQARARKAAASVTGALSASVDELARRVRGDGR